MFDATGFVSPAKSYEEKGFDFNKILISNPPATFTMRADTDKLVYKGILPNALLIVDRSLKPKSGDIVVYSELGEFFCREIYIKGNRKFFIDEKGEEIPRRDKIVFYGVVTKSINIYDFSC